MTTSRTVLLAAIALVAAPVSSIVREPAAMPTRASIVAVPVAGPRRPARGPSRDRALPGKARIRARRDHLESQ